MTARRSIVDISTMIETADEFVEFVEKERDKRGWSLLEVAKKTAPEAHKTIYSWLIDQDRNRPQKLYTKRVKQVMATFERHPVNTQEKLHLSETERALFEALKGVVSIISSKGSPGQRLEDFFSDQIDGYQTLKQRDAAEVMRQLLSSVHSAPPTSKTPTSRKYEQLERDQSHIQKNPKN